MIDQPFLPFLLTFAVRELIGVLVSLAGRQLSNLGSRLEASATLS